MIFSEHPSQRPVVILPPEVRPQHLHHVLQFVYKGEVQVSTDYFIVSVTSLERNEQEQEKNLLREQLDLAKAEALSLNDCVKKLEKNSEVDKQTIDNMTTKN